MPIPEKLKVIASQVKGEGGNPTATVRELLGWFGAARRGKHKIAEIEAALRKLKIETWPEFGDVYIDGEIEFRSSGGAVAEKTNASQLIPGGSEDADYEDPVPRLAVLQAANTLPVSIKRDDPISKAFTLMLSHDFSQLPVMQSERSPEGFISWKTIGTNVSLNKKCERVRDAMDTMVAVLPADMPLFEAVAGIVKGGFVLVKGAGQKITGLVTTSDISLQFNELSKPFLLLSQMKVTFEGCLRTGLLTRKFARSPTLLMPAGVSRRFQI